MMTAHEARRLWAYNAETGVFTWRVRPARNVMAGSEAGTWASRGYRQIKYCGRPYSAHRLAWLYVYGEWPQGVLDHLNRDTSDNRICNLRVADLSQNRANSRMIATNSSGRRGVSWNKARKKWCASIVVDGVRRFLGYFSDLDAAAEAYLSAYSRQFHAFATGECKSYASI